MLNYEAKVRYKDYLPTPLKNITPLIKKRQLVYDIKNSSKYLSNFPVLEFIDNFDFRWKEFVNKVSLFINDRRVNSDFVSKWSLFYTEISGLKFSSGTITTISYDLMNLWPLDFSFMDLDYKDIELIDYFDRILNPSTDNLWQDLLDSTEELYDKYINSYIEKLDDLRNIKNIDNFNVQTDDEILKLTAKMVGINLREDILSAIGGNRLASIIPLLNDYQGASSSNNFIKVLELFIGSNVLINYLYSKDYINFKTYDEIPQELYQNSDKFWFKTTHINVFVEYNGVQFLTKELKAPLGSSVYDILKVFLPINLVLKNFGFYLDLNTVETAPAINFSGVIESVHAKSNLLADKQTTPSPKPYIEEYLFDKQEDIDRFIQGYRPPTQKEIFDSWSRIADNNFYTSSSSFSGEAAAWRFDESTENIICTKNTDSYVGFISSDKLDKFSIEATLSSTDQDDDLIGVIIAFDRIADNNVYISAVRTNGGLGNYWSLLLYDGKTQIPLAKLNTPLTEGYKNPSYKGWQMSGPTRINIAKNGTLITAKCSKFGTLTLEDATTLTYDLNSRELTKNLIGAKSYGYLACSQFGATFSDVNVVKSIDYDLSLYDIVNNKVYRFRNATNKWEKSDYTFVDSAEYPRRYFNPYTEVMFTIDPKKKLRRRY